ncbi:MAG: YceD family protein [Porticoccaceae bacterium]|jgi:uncharacterized protein|nr:YceD family protein [Porticoccaceae bacterium]
MSDLEKMNRLPKSVDPRKLAAQGVQLQGSVPTADMDRLLSAVVSARQAAQVALAFSQDEAHRTIIAGSFHIDVDMECQRCLQPVTQSLSGELCLAVVWDEERAAVLPKTLDPLVVSDDSVDLYGLLEDEILLALPIVAYHQEGQCQRSGHYSTGEVEESRENPFSILAQLKK